MTDAAPPSGFAAIQSSLPAIDHLRGLDVLDADGALVHHIPAQPGKLGSLRIYHALALRFDGALHAEAVALGLRWFAEHVNAARHTPGSHPNIDVLLRPGVGALGWCLRPLPRDTAGR